MRANLKGTEQFAAMSKPTVIFAIFTAEYQNQRELKGNSEDTQKGAQEGTQKGTQGAL